MRGCSTRGSTAVDALAPPLIRFHDQGIGDVTGSRAAPYSVGTFMEEEPEAIELLHLLDRKTPAAITLGGTRREPPPGEVIAAVLATSFSSSVVENEKRSIDRGPGSTHAYFEKRDSGRYLTDGVSSLRRRNFSILTVERNHADRDGAMSSNAAV